MHVRSTLVGAHVPGTSPPHHPPRRVKKGQTEGVSKASTPRCCNLYLGELSVPVYFWKHSDSWQKAWAAPHTGRDLSRSPRCLLQVCGVG